MSTLKVNAIEPYSGGTVTITGATVENATSASYALTASFALNAGGGTDLLPLNNTWTGANTFNQEVNLSGGAIAPYQGAVKPIRVFLSGSGGTFPNIQLGGFDFGGQPFGSIDVNQAAGFNINVYEPASNIRMSVGAGGNINTVADGFRVEPTTTGSFNSIQMSSQGNFFSDYYGFMASENRLAGSPNNGNSNATVGAQNKASLTVNAFPTNGAYDELFEVIVDANGATLQDWVLPSYTPTPWLNIPQQGTPSFKRGLDVQGGTMTLPGLGDYVDDAAAATGGVPVNGIYRTGSTLKIRVS